MFNFGRQSGTDCMTVSAQGREYETVILYKGPRSYLTVEHRLWHTSVRRTGSCVPIRELQTALSSGEPKAREVKRLRGRFVRENQRVSKLQERHFLEAELPRLYHLHCCFER